LAVFYKVIDTCRLFPFSYIYTVCESDIAKSCQHYSLQNEGDFRWGAAVPDGMLWESALTVTVLR
jgi:hypothetical protein